MLPSSPGGPRSSSRFATTMAAVTLVAATGQLVVYAAGGWVTGGGGSRRLSATGTDRGQADIRIRRPIRRTNGPDR
jgi:hypothetical protein